MITEMVLYGIACDGSGCDKAFDGENISVYDIEIMAEREGWEVGARHLCPTCKEPSDD